MIATSLLHAQTPSVPAASYNWSGQAWGWVGTNQNGTCNSVAYGSVDIPSAASGVIYPAGGGPAGAFYSFGPSVTSVGSSATYAGGAYGIGCQDESAADARLTYYFSVIAPPDATAQYVPIDASGNAFVSVATGTTPIGAIGAYGGFVISAAQISGNPNGNPNPSADVFPTCVPGGNQASACGPQTYAVSILAPAASETSSGYSGTVVMYANTSNNAQPRSYPCGSGVCLPATAASGYIQIDPTFLAANRGYSLVFSPGIGNLPSNSAAVKLAQAGPVTYGATNVCPGGQGTAPCTQSETLTYFVNSNVTLGTPVVLTNGVANLDFTLGSGSACVGVATAGSTCTVNVNFTPQAAGLRKGAIELVDGSGNILATNYLNGTATAPQIVFAPATPSTVNTTGLASAAAVALDGAGNLYIADSANNVVVKLPAGGGAQTAVGSGLAGPKGVAVDAAGDVYIADTGNNRVLELPANGGTAIAVGSGFTAPQGVAVDAGGDVFVADTVNSRVVEVFPGGTQSVVLASGLMQPVAVAVDEVGDVFIADSGLNQVVEVPAGGGTQNTIGTGLSAPSGVALDIGGNVFIADAGNARVVEVAAGTLAQSVVSSGAATAGLAVTAAGDVYLAQGATSQVVLLTRSQAPAVIFPDTAIGTTSAAQQVTVENIGNAPLNVTGLVVSAGFAQVAGSGTPADCNATAVLATNASCNLSLVFQPGSTGPFTGTAVLTDNTLNGVGVTQTIGLNGVGAGSAQTITFTPISTGTVGNSAILSATASSGLPVSFYSSSPSVCSVSGSTLAFVGAGTCTITAAQSGSPIYGSTAVTQSFAVAQVTQTIAFGPIVTQTIGVPLSLSASASSGLPVAFSSATPAVCAVSGSTATFVAVGTCTIVASQGGNATYSAAASVTQSFAAVTANSVSPATYESYNGGCGLCAADGPIVNFGQYILAASPFTPISETVTAGVVWATRTLSLGGMRNYAGMSSAPGINNAGGANSTLTIYFSVMPPAGASTSTTVPVVIAGTVDLSVSNPMTSQDYVVVTVFPQGVYYGATLQWQWGCGNTNAPPGCGTSIYQSTVQFSPGFQGVVRLINQVDGSGDYLGGCCQTAGSAVAYTPFPRIYIDPAWLAANPGYTLVLSPGIAYSGPVTTPTVQLQTPASNPVTFTSANVCPGGQGTAPCTQAQTLTYTANSNVTLGTPLVLTDGVPNLDFTLGSGNTCTGAVASGSSCTVTVNFTPKLAGLRRGAVEIVDNNGNILSTTYLNATATAPQIVFAPGVPSAVNATGLQSASAVAVDGAGNLYIADTTSNVVIKVPAGGAQTTVGSGLSGPKGVAVDAAGNVYIADTGHNQVLEVPANGGSPVSLGSGLSRPQGVAVDASGTVYIADTGNSRVLEILPGNVQEGSVLASGLMQPVAVAVDAVGDVFIADSGLNQVVEVPAGGGTQNTIGTGLSAPSGVALDIGGNVFIADAGNARVLEVAAGTGAQSVVSSGTATAGLAVTAAGDVYLAQGAASQVVLLTRSQAPAVIFPDTTMGTTSAAQQVTLENIGNAPLNLSGLVVGAGFAQVAGSGTPADCSATTVLAADASCNLSLVFQPGSTGPFTGTAVLTDNTLNGVGVTQSIGLSGVGAGSAQTITFTPILSGTVGNSAILSATASSGLPVSFYSSSPSVCSVSGSTLAFVGAGTCTITAAQSGSPIYGSTAVTQSFAVAQVTQTIAFGPIVTQTIGVPLSLSASASSGLPVAFSSATPAVCAVSGSTATFVAVGTCTIVASQGGNATYSAAASVTQSFAAVTANSVSPATYESYNSGAGLCAGDGPIVNCGQYILTASPFTPISETVTAGVVWATRTLSLGGMRNYAGMSSAPGINNGGVANSTLTIYFSVMPPAGASTSTTVPVVIAGTVDLSVSNPMTSQDYVVVTVFPQGVYYGATLQWQWGCGNTNAPPGCGTSIYQSTVQFSPGFQGVVRLINQVDGSGDYLGGCCQTAGSAVAYTPFPRIYIDPAWLAANPGYTLVLSPGIAYSGPVTTPTVQLQTPASNPVTLASANVCPGGQGTAPCTQAQTLSYTANSNVTLGTPLVLTDGVPNLDFTLGSGNTCAGAVASGSSCTVTVNFTPTLAGLRKGAVEIVDNNGNILSTTYLNATATAPQIVFAPGVPSGVNATGLQSAAAVAVDGAGNLYIADTTSNVVVKVPAGGGAQTTVGSGLVAPKGVAVDGAGNVYIADTGNNRVLEVPSNGGSPVSLGSGLSAPQGVAVDASGTVYIADTGNSRVLEILPGNVQEGSVLASGLMQPVAVAVDGVGDVFIADSGLNQVVEVPAGGSQSTVGTGLLAPSGVAVDIGGNVFIADAGNGRVVEVAAGTGAQSVLSGEAAGVAVSAAGDLFLAQGAASQVILLTRSQAPALSFLNTAVGTTSSAQSVTVQNIGNAAFNVSGITVNGAFTQVAGSGTPADCSSTTSLAAGASCNLSIAFQPTAINTFSGTAVLTDNALNGAPATQTIALSGSGAATSAQAISFGPVGTQFVGTPLALSAVASSGLAVSYAASPSSVCSVAGNIATFAAPGICTITASQAGNGAFTAATPVTQTFAVLQGQTITFGAIATQLVGTPLTLGAKASSGLAVSYSSSNAAVCTVANGVATFLAAGTCSITASQAGNATYAPATPVTQTFAVLQGQTITFGPFVTQFVGTPLSLNGTASSGLTVSYNAGPASVCTVANGVATLLTAGTCTITASQAGNATYMAATPVTQSFAVFVAQTITFNPISTQVVGIPLTLSATASSGLNVSYSAAPSNVCSVTGSKASFVGTGTCTITASQAGNSAYAAATAVSQSFPVLLAQSIAFGTIATQSVGTPFSLSATASSGLPVSFSSSTPAVCTVNGSTVTFVAGGTCSIVAAQSGNSTYAPAASVTQSFKVSAGLATVVSVTPNIGTGSPQAFTAVVSDPNGAADLNAVYLLFNSSVSSVNGCYVLYEPAANQLFLKNNAGTANSAALTPGVAGQVSNSQCTLSGLGSSYVENGNAATLTVSLSFNASTATNVYLYATGKLGGTTGFVQKGNWGVSEVGPGVGSLSPSGGAGLSQIFSATVSDVNGTGDISGIFLLINSRVVSSHGCYVTYYPSSNQLFLKNDAGTAYSVAVTPGSTKTVSNSQCTLAGTGSSYTTSGNSGTLKVALTFSGSAPQYVYVLADDKNGLNSGWVQKGTWGVSAGAPSAVSVTPDSGSGATQTFSAVFSDPNGAGDLTTLQILFNSKLASANACYVTYNPVANLLYLTNNTDTGQSAGITPGSAATVSNSQCTLAAAGSSYTASGNTATLNVELTFTGSKPALIYMWAGELMGSNTGWVKKGVWGASAGAPSVVSLTPDAGSGATQSFTGVFSDPNGAADLSSLEVLFNTQVEAAHACYVTYNPVKNLLFLTNDADSGQSAGIAPGSAGAVANSQCTLSGTGSTYSVTGNTASLTLALKFSGTSATNVYLNGAEINGSTSGWVKEGSWTP